MFRKNPVYELELNYLREVHPYRWWHNLLLIPAYIAVCLPILHPKSIINHYFPMLYLTTFVVLGTFWAIQLGFTALAAHLSNRQYDDEEQAIITGYSSRQIVMSKLWAIFHHTWLWLVLWLPVGAISILTFRLFMLTAPQVIYIFDAVADFSSSKSSNWSWLSRVSVFEYFIGVYIIRLPLLVLGPLFTVLATTVLSFAIGLWRGQRNRIPVISTIMIRIAFVILMVIVAFICATLRFTWLSHVQPLSFYDAPLPYPQFDENSRLVIISLEITATSAIDNGILGSSVIWPCIRYTYPPDLHFRYGYTAPFVIRNLLAMGLSAFLQWVFAIFLLRRTIQQSTKKKK